MTRHVRREYPTLAKNLTFSNAYKLVHGIYGAIVNYIVGLVYESQYEEYLTRNRIGAKVAEITRNPSEVQQYYYTANVDYLNPGGAGRQHVDGGRGFGKRSSQVKNHKKRSFTPRRNLSAESSNRRSDDQTYVMVIRPRQVQAEVPQANESDTIEFEEDTSFFDIEDYLFGSFGIYTKNLKRFSLAYCSKQYVVNVFQRIVQALLFS